MTADWPEPGLTVLDAATLAVREEHDSEVRQVYDLAPFGGPRGLALAQHDPLARGDAPRYGYVLSYDLPEGSGTEPGVPRSHAVGADPVRVVPVPGAPFLLTADSGTNGIHVVNPLGDRRSLAVCDAPREIAVSADGRRTAVVCWRGRGAPVSQVLLLDSDYEARPWPRLERLAQVEVAGGGGGTLRAAARAPVGGRPYRRPPDRLRRRSARAGRRGAGGRAARGPGDHHDEPPPVRAGARRSAAAPATAGGARRDGRSGGSFPSLSWTEVVSWQEAAATAGGDGEAAVRPVERSRRIAAWLGPDGELRRRDAAGTVRIAAGGDAVTLDAEGRFWTTSRQDLLGVVLALPAMAPEEAVRRLAGDVPGGTGVVNGIAVDRVTEVEEGGTRYLVVGADPAGERVSQLWIDLDRGLPVQPVERFPVFGGAHRGGGPPEIAETELSDWRSVGPGGPPLPRTLRRTLEGRWVQHARLAEVRMARRRPGSLFYVARLGGVRPGDGLFAAAPGAAVARGSPPLANPFAGAAPYASTLRRAAPTSPGHRTPASTASPSRCPCRSTTCSTAGSPCSTTVPAGVRIRRRPRRVSRRHDGVLVAPYPWLDGHRLALTAWGTASSPTASTRRRCSGSSSAGAAHPAHGRGLTRRAGRPLPSRSTIGRPGGRSTAAAARRAGRSCGPGRRHGPGVPGAPSGSPTRRG